MCKDNIAFSVDRAHQVGEFEVRFHGGMATDGKVSIRRRAFFEMYCDEMRGCVQESLEK